MLYKLKSDRPNAMKQFLLNLNRFKSVRLLLPVFLGFVILTASTNLPDLDDVASTYESTDMNTSLISDESEQTESSESTSELSSEKALGWGAKSDVLP